MSATPEQLRQWDREHVWHPFTQMKHHAADDPPIIDRAEGCYLFDIDGRRYIDGVSSLWCIVLGHRHPHIDHAIRDQLDRVAHTTLLGASSVPAIRLARKLVELAPPGLNHVFYSDDGSTAVEVALKIAFQYWQQRPDPRPDKTRFLKLGGAYHGDTIGAVSVGGIDLFHTVYRPMLFDTLTSPQPYCYRCPLGLDRSGCRHACVRRLQDLVAEHHDQLAALILEPLIQGAAGMVCQPEGYVRAAREVTREHDVLLICDEVASGFGRTGSLFACEQEDVCPDLLCLAKGLTGGYLPVAATLATDAIHDAFLGDHAEAKTFYHGHTYTGNALGCAAGLASLEVFESEDTLGRTQPKIARLTEHLRQMAQLPHVGDVRQRGLMAGVELVSDKAHRTPYPPAERVGARVCKEARPRGLLIRPLGDVIIILPPLAMSMELLDEMCTTIVACIRTVTESD